MSNYELHFFNKKAREIVTMRIAEGTRAEMAKEMNSRLQTDKDNHYSIYFGKDLVSSTMNGGALPHVWQGFERKKHEDGSRKWSTGGRKQAGLR